MAEIEKIIPHILLWEVGKTKEEREGKIWEGLTPRKIYDLVKSRGYHNLPNDKGGPTMCGITLRTFTEWCRWEGRPKPTVEEQKGLCYDNWLEILKGLFWRPCGADYILNQSIAEMLVDWRWVNGTQAVRDAQTVLSCVADGIVGPKTLAALNAKDDESVFIRLKNARLRSYTKIVERNPSQGKWLKGWRNRTNSIHYEP